MILPMIPHSLTIFRGSILGLLYPFLCPRYESEISQVRRWRESRPWEPCVLSNTVEGVRKARVKLVRTRSAIYGYAILSSRKSNLGGMGLW
jgi:hypothetical protein